MWNVPRARNIQLIWPVAGDTSVTRVLNLMIALLCVTAVLTGCRVSGGGSKAFPMGERVTVGPFIYTVLEANWKTEINTPEGPKLPRNRYLLLRLSVTNSGGGEASMPMLVLKNDKSEEFREQSGVEGVPNWFGLLRRIPAAETENGIVVFDAPMGAYQLELSDGAPPGEERTSLVDIPLQFAPQGPLPENLAPKSEGKQ